MLSRTPSVLKGRNQLSENKALLIQQIAWKIIHVECMVQRSWTFSFLCL